MQTKHNALVDGQSGWLLLETEHYEDEFVIEFWKDGDVIIEADSSIGLKLSDVIELNALLSAHIAKFTGD